MVMITNDGLDKIINEFIKIIRAIELDKVSNNQLKEYMIKIIKQYAFHDDDKWIKMR